MKLDLLEFSKRLRSKIDLSKQEETRLREETSLLFSALFGARYLYVPDHGCDHCTAAWSVCIHDCTIRPASRGCNATASVGVETANSTVAPPCNSRFKTGHAVCTRFTNEFRQVIDAGKQAHTWPDLRQVTKFGAAVLARFARESHFVVRC